MRTLPSLVTMLLVPTLLHAAGASGQNPEKIGALGRIQPESGIVTITGPVSEVVNQVLTHQGASVQSGEPLLVLRGNEAAMADLAHAKEALRDAEENGPRAIEIQEIKLRQAVADCDYTAARLARLKKADASSISDAMAEQRAYQASQAQLARDIAERELQRVKSEVQSAVERAKSQVANAKARLAATTILAPFEGTVIELPAHEGDLASQPLIRFADLRGLVVIADVYEEDLLRLREGMKAEVSCPALSKPLKGEIVSVGRIVSENTKIAKVKVRLSGDLSEAARLLNVEVNVSFAP